MNPMRIFVMLWLILLPLFAFGDDTGAASRYSQSYAILIKGSMAGTETVLEKIDDNGDIVVTSEHEILLTDGLETNRLAFSTKLVFRNSGFFPISYAYKHTAEGSGDSYDVVVEGGTITRTLHRGGNTSIASAPMKPDMVLLDFSVYHHYDYLVRMYDTKKGGRQFFSDFVPLIANDIPIALTFLGTSNLKLEKSTLAIRNFRIEFVDIWSGTLSVDEDDRLVRLTIPAQDLEVVRKDLVP